MRHIVDAGGEVLTPKLEFVLGKLGGVDEFLEGEAGRGGGFIADEAHGFALEGTPFALDEVAAFARVEFDKIREPVGGVAGEPRIEARTPPWNTLVAGVWSGAIDEEEEADVFTLVFEVARHFVSDIPAETIAAEIVRAFALEGAKILDVT